VITPAEKAQLAGLLNAVPTNPNGASPAAPFAQLIGDSIEPSLPKATILFNKYQPGINLIQTPS
jgi:hypothetical protein